LRLSAIHLAQPNVPAGPLSAGSQHSPDDCGWQMSGQTTPIESKTVKGQSTSHHFRLSGIGVGHDTSAFEPS